MGSFVHSLSMPLFFLAVLTPSGFFFGSLHSRVLHTRYCSSNFESSSLSSTFAPQVKTARLPFFFPPFLGLIEQTQLLANSQQSLPYSSPFSPFLFSLPLLFLGPFLIGGVWRPVSLIIVSSTPVLFPQVLRTPFLFFPFFRSFFPL